MSNLKKILPSAKNFQIKLTSVEAVQVFMSDVQSVFIWHEYTHAVDHVTDSLFCQ